MKRSQKLIAIGLLAAAVTAAVSVGNTTTASAGNEPIVRTEPVRGRMQSDPKPGLPITKALVPANGIDYHGGPVMKGTVNVYVIWYGNWAANKKTIINTFVNNFSNSPRYKVNTTYADTTGAISGTLAVGASTTDNYSQGKVNLTDSAILKVVSTAIVSGRLPKDPNGVYFVFTSADVTKKGFLTSYCGWHTHSTIAATDIKFAYVGDPTGTLLGNCAAQRVSPNGDAGADAMVSVIAHELEEAASDPDLNAWYDSTGAENADKCAWKFGTTTALPTGALYNITLGGMKFLVQQNWRNSLGGACAMA